MRFRRTSDSVAYACTWWFAFLLFNGGLVYYAATKIIDVRSRDFFLQTTELPRSHFNGTMSFPDIMMCSTATDISRRSSFSDTGGRNITINHISINSSSLPMYRDLCNVHPWLTIFSTEERYVNVTQNEDSLFWFELAPKANASLWFAWIYFVPNYNNPFRSHQDVAHDIWYDLFDNEFSMTQNNTLLTLQVVNVATYALRTDFWGYFGILQKVPTRSVKTESTSAYYYGPSTVQVFFPRKEIERRQILLTSVISAFADWGGWFSVVYGIFYILFGSPRLDPFGLVALLFLTNKAKRKILKAYGPLPQQSPSPYGPDAYSSCRMSNSSTITSMSSYNTDPTVYNQMSPTSPDSYSKLTTQNVPYQTQRMIDQRFRRLERMLSEFYLNMPADDLQQDEEEEGGKRRRWFWERGRRGASAAESDKSGDEYFGVDLRATDPYHDQVPLRGYDSRSVAREE